MTEQANKVGKVGHKLRRAGVLGTKSKMRVVIHFSTPQAVAMEGVGVDAVESVAFTP